MRDDRRHRQNLGQRTKIRCDRRENRCASIAAIGDGNMTTPADDVRRKPMGEVPENDGITRPCLEKDGHTGHPR
jgi:hypothetical protein